MPQYLYKIQPTRPEMLMEGSTAEEDEITTQHFYYLKNLMDEGQVLLAGRTLNTDYSSFGIIIFQAENDEQAKQIMLNDPAIQNKVMRGEVYPYRVAIASENIVPKE